MYKKKDDLNKQNLKEFNLWSRYYDTPIFTWYFKRGYSMLKKALGEITGKNLVSVGCGTGTLEIDLANQNPKAKIFGFDLSPMMIKEARRKGKKIKNLEFINGESSKLPFKDKSVDIVIILHAFHHFPQQKRALQEISRILTKHGKLYIVDPVKQGILGKLHVLISSFLENGVTFYTFNEIKKLANEAGFTNVEMNNSAFRNYLIEAKKKN